MPHISTLASTYTAKDIPANLRNSIPFPLVIWPRERGKPIRVWRKLIACLFSTPIKRLESTEKLLALRAIPVAPIEVKRSDRKTAVRPIVVDVLAAPSPLSSYADFVPVDGSTLPVCVDD